MEYEIFADAACDLDDDLRKKYDIKFVPMEYSIGDEYFSWEGGCADREEMHKFYDRLRKEKAPTSTSQPPPNRFYEAFEPVIKAGKGIIDISISEGVSGTYGSAVTAANMIKEKYPDAVIEIVDSLAGSFGSGMLAGLAGKAREAGTAIKENAAWLKEHAMNVRCFVKLEDLMFLKRGGRLPAATAVIGTALNIKPVMFFDSEGKAAMASKHHGAKMAMNAILDYFEKLWDKDPDSLVYVVDTDAEAEAERLKAELLRRYPSLNISRGEINPIVGSLLGPDVCGIVFCGQSKDETAA